MRAAPKYCQPPRNRTRYQRISTRRLPDQMISHWEKETYAHSTTKANVSLPKSCRKSILNILEIGSMGASFTSSQTVKHSAVSTSPTMKIMPQTVENHFGSSDMAQSMEPKVMVAA